jgi:hypothetical protein
MIGLLIGDGNLPKILIKKLQLKKIKFIVVNLSKKKNSKNFFYNFNISQFSKIVKTLKKNDCKEVILAGKVTRPRIEDIKVDFSIMKILPKIILSLKKGDSHALDFVINYLNQMNMKVVSCTKYLPELLAENFVNKFKLTKQDLRDVEKGKAILNHVNKKYDIGQSIIVNKGLVVGMEAAEGTDEMILKSSSIMKKINKKMPSGVLIKVPKKIQDLRVDLPTIGYNTIRNCIKIGLRGIALKKNQNIFLDQEKSLNLIKKNNFFITVIN